MKIENQVCTLNQAKRLKELGIEQSGIMMYYESSIGVVLINKLQAETLDNEWCAFTVAELGAMLSEIDDGQIDVTCFYNFHMGFWDGCITKHTGGDDPEMVKFDFECDTEAEVRADALIYLLNEKLANIEDCNILLNQ